MERPPGDPTSVNRAHWDRMADVHADLARTGSTAYYDLDALLAGKSSLSAVEREGLALAVGDVRGLRVLHAQCHLAFDGISMARAGAEVTALDLSPQSLGHAADIAQRCGVQIEFVESDIVDPPARLAGRFDLVYASFGILCWIADVDAWMRAVHALLKPGGALLLVEVHPLYFMVEQVSPLRLDFPYAYAGPRTFEEEGTYADPTSSVSTGSTIEFAHSLGEVVTAAVQAGLRVERLDEELGVEVDPRGNLLQPDADGVLRLHVAGEALPVVYRLICRKPDGDDGR